MPSSQRRQGRAAAATRRGDVGGDEEGPSDDVASAQCLASTTARAFPIPVHTAEPLLRALLPTSAAALEALLSAAGTIRPGQAGRPGETVMARLELPFEQVIRVTKPSECEQVNARAMEWCSDGQREMGKASVYTGDMERGRDLKLIFFPGWGRLGACETRYASTSGDLLLW